MGKFPSVSIIAIVKNCIIMPSGLVVDKNRSYPFGHWYWSKPFIKKDKYNNEMNTNIASNKYITFVQVFQEFFQHVAFDTLPKLSFTCDFIKLHSDVIVLV